MAADEETYTSEDDYQSKSQTKLELIQLWDSRISAALRVKRTWSQRFKVNTCYQYYEGYQHLMEMDENNRPYVVNMVYSTIENKLPNMLFDSPEFHLKPKPVGNSWDFESASKEATIKEDALNFVVQRTEFGLNDKHELALLDAFFGFGVIESGYSNDPCINPYITPGSKEILNKLYCKQIPFDQFVVSAHANWDLSTGRWYGYWEDLPLESLEEYKNKLNFDFNQIETIESDFASLPQTNDGRIVIGELGDTTEIPVPVGHLRIWKIWDFNTMKFIKYLQEGTISESDKLLEYKTFKHSPISTIRYTKRRKGWYPLPPVFQWLHPQDEINDIRQTHKLHRKRFSRKYAIKENAMEPEEVDKFLYGPDGTCFKVKGNANEAITPVQDAALDTANQQSLIVSYDDMNRVSGTSDEQRAVADRQTATQSNIINNRAQIRESKDLLRVGEFLTSIARNVLHSLGSASGSFWIQLKAGQEGLLSELKPKQPLWRQIPTSIFKEENYDLTISVSSISPVYQGQDKKTFMEFLAVITQYEILSMSPALLREAAYRIGYRNETVLSQFQQLAQLAAIGKTLQAKAAIQQVAPQGPQGAQPGQLAQQQTDASTPPDLQEISNLIFNKGGVQQ